MSRPRAPPPALLAPARVALLATGASTIASTIVALRAKSESAALRDDCAAQRSKLQCETDAKNDLAKDLRTLATGKAEVDSALLLEQSARERDNKAKEEAAKRLRSSLENEKKARTRDIEAKDAVSAKLRDAEKARTTAEKQCNEATRKLKVEEAAAQTRLAEMAKLEAASTELAQTIAAFEDAQGCSVTEVESLTAQVAKLEAAMADAAAQVQAAQASLDEAEKAKTASAEECTKLQGALKQAEASAADAAAKAEAAATDKVASLEKTVAAMEASAAEAASKAAAEADELKALQATVASMETQAAEAAAKARAEAEEMSVLQDKAGALEAAASAAADKARAEAEVASELGALTEQLAAMEASASEVADKAKAEVAEELAALQSTISALEANASDVAAKATAAVAKELTVCTLDTESLSKQLEEASAAGAAIDAAKAGLQIAQALLSTQASVLASRCEGGAAALATLDAQAASERATLVASFEASGALAAASSKLGTLNLEAVDLRVKVAAMKAEPPSDGPFAFFENFQRDGAIESVESSLLSVTRRLGTAYDELPDLLGRAQTEQADLAAALAELDAKFEAEEAALTVSRAEVAAAKAEVDAFEKAAAAIAVVL